VSSDLGVVTLGLNSAFQSISPLSSSCPSHFFAVAVREFVWPLRSVVVLIIQSLACGIQSTHETKPGNELVLLVLQSISAISHDTTILILILMERYKCHSTVKIQAPGSGGMNGLLSNNAPLVEDGGVSRS
jgi:hypothetical protein